MRPRNGVETISESESVAIKVIFSSKQITWMGGNNTWVTSKRYEYLC